MRAIVAVGLVSAVLLMGCSADTAPNQPATFASRAGMTATARCEFDCDGGPKVRLSPTVIKSTATPTATEPTLTLNIQPTIASMPTPIPPAPAPTNRPPTFARFTAADVVAAFKRFGLEAVEPEPLSAQNFASLYGQFPLVKGQVANVANTPTGSPMIQVLTFTDPTAAEKVWEYLLSENVSGPFLNRQQLRNANLILVSYVSSQRPPDISAYQAAFIGMR